jgi:non-specific serine/threonine protein kinase
VAARLGVSEQVVRRAIVRGELAAVKRGRAWSIGREELARFAEGRDRSRADETSPRLVVLPHPPVATLPTPVSRFIGREAESAVLAALLADPAERLITLTGPGGIGKTRLALAAATAAQDRFPDGAYFVDLSAITEPPLVVPAIAQAVGLREQSGQDRRGQLAAFLRGKQALLVLDNFEQILGAAPEVSRLLADAPGVRALVTSRAPLRIGGERVLPAAPLTLPDPGAGLAALLASDAGRLFVARAEEHDPGFAVDDTSAPVVADICARLDGLPLAIELAAARSRLLPPCQLRDRLERRLPFLTLGARDAPARLQTMRDAIAWSYDLLREDEQRRLRRLAVFAGGFTLQAAEAVLGACGDDSGHDGRAVVDAIAALLDQSLLLSDRGADGEPRLRMLETIREFGLERLDGAEADAVRDAHAAYYLQLAQDLRPLVDTLSLQGPLDRLAAEDANVRAALAWLDERQDVAGVAAMVAACWLSWYAAGQLQEAEIWLERALGRLDEAAARDRALLLIAHGVSLMVKGDHEGASDIFAVALPRAREVGDPFDLAMGLIAAGAALNNGGDFAAAEPYFHEALALADAVTEPRPRAAVASSAHGNLTVSAMGQGDLVRAEAHNDEAMRHTREQELGLAEMRVLLDRAGIARVRGQYAVSVACCQTALSRLGEAGEARLVTQALSGIASAAVSWGLDRPALLLFGAADALRERAGVGMHRPRQDPLTQRDLEALRGLAGADEVDAILAEGRRLSPAEVMAMAATVCDPGGDPAAIRGPTVPTLTRRQRQVLDLVAAGQTDREIAAALFLSSSTASWHVRSILAKLGVSSRREAITRARVQGLLSS